MKKSFKQFTTYFFYIFLFIFSNKIIAQTECKVPSTKGLSNEEKKKVVQEYKNCLQQRAEARRAKKVESQEQAAKREEEKKQLRSKLNEIEDEKKKLREEQNRIRLEYQNSQTNTVEQTQSAPSATGTRPATRPRRSRPSSTSTRSTTPVSERDRQIIENLERLQREREKILEDIRRLRIGK